MKKSKLTCILLVTAVLCFSFTGCSRNSGKRLPLKKFKQIIHRKKTVFRTIWFLRPKPLRLPKKRPLRSSRPVISPD